MQLLEEVEVPNAARRLDDYPHQYSGGMRQRVVIAIALANDPDVVIADEPTTALDVTTQAQVLDLLDRLVTQHGAAVILITHNLGIVAEFCDACAGHVRGPDRRACATADIFARPTHPYTEALLRSVPRPDRLAARAACRRSRASRLTSPTSRPAAPSSRAARSDTDARSAAPSRRRRSTSGRRSVRS